MKAVFVAIGGENLAIEFLSSFLKSRGHNVEVVFDPRVFSTEILHIKKLADFFETKNEIVKQILEKKPDLICFSVFTLNYQRALAIAREIRKYNKVCPIVFGGIHVISVPEIVIQEDCVDIICVGEGEEAIAELLDNVNDEEKKYEIKNLWLKKNGKIIKNTCRPLIDDLDSLPFPDKDLFNKIYPGFMKDYYTISSRGCPFACNYCANNVLHEVFRGLGRVVRRRSPENIIAELELAKKKYAPIKITFVDDVFVQDVKWLERFVSLYKEKIKLPYLMLTHPRFVTPDIAKLLRRSGCYLLCFGIQSASEKTRREILNRFETNEEIRLAAKNCHKFKLPFSIDHIFNIPTEGIKECEEALIFYNELRPTIINSYQLQYLPKTKIIQKAKEQGILKEADIINIEKGIASTSIVLGFGDKDKFNPRMVYANFQFFFMLLPVLPKWIMDWIIKKKFYLIKFKIPTIFSFGLKFLISLLKKRGGVYAGIFKSTLHFILMNLRLKSKYRKLDNKINYEN
jgi:radical SAM superfamily enzyme YgiQ (UPF0313 family)